MKRMYLARRIALGALPLLAACAGATPTPATQPSNAQAPGQTGPDISEADLRSRLYLVADDSMGGRPTGSPGHVKVTEYIAREMQRLGLQPAGEGGTYFQNVPFVRRTLVAGSGLDIEGKKLEPLRDFAAADPNGPTRPLGNVQVIYGGLITDTMTQITREQAAGKFVVLRAPATGLYFARGVPSSRWADAAGIATVNSEAARRFWPQLSAGGPVRVREAPPGGRPVQPQPLMLEAAGAAVLMGMPWDTTIKPGTLGKVVNGRIAFNEEQLVARNVVAILPGSDAALRNQYVAIGAHSDHDPIRRPAVDHDSLKVFNALARRMRIERTGPVTAEERAAIRVNVDSLRAIRPARRDSIMNGADDDGSGTVAMLEIAEAMAAAPTKPRRSTLFVWHVAEELGLIGAEYYTDNPTVPRDSIVTTLNIDMIGRGGAGEEIGGGPTYLQLIGWRRLSNELGDIIDATNKAQAQPFRFDLTFDAAGHREQYYCRSDHYMYARYGIPVSFFTTGSHGDYHQVTDEPQYIDYTKLRNVTKLIHDVALRVGNLDHRPVVDGPKPDPKGQCRQ